MLYITQLIYITPGEEEQFNAFENLAIALIEKYNGSLLLRLRPGADSFIAGNMEPPYEIHLVSFDTPADFEHFRNDETRNQFLHLKEASVRASLLIKGTAL